MHCCGACIFSFNLIKYKPDSSVWLDETSWPANTVHRWGEQPAEQRCWVDMPQSIRSNTSALTCTLCPFKSHFQPAMALLSASHISPLTSNHQAPTAPDSNPCPPMSTGLNVLWIFVESELSQACRNILMHVREGGGIFFDTCQNHSCDTGTSLSRHTCSVSFKLSFSLIFLSFLARLMSWGPEVFVLQ